jgi:hypothetical protein
MLHLTINDMRLTGLREKEKSKKESEEKRRRN